MPDAADPEARAAVLAGVPTAIAGRGDGEAFPEYYANAYAPVMADDGTAAVVAVSIDQTATRTALLKRIAGAVAALMVVLILAAGVPLAVVLRRAKAIRKGNLDAQFLARHDTLTGLFSRAYLVSLIEDWQQGGRPVALCAIDLDRFSAVIDAIGHANGDALLRQVADRLHSVLGPGPAIARMDGDGFAVACPDIGSEADAESLARQVLAAFTVPFAVAGGHISVSASVGVTVSLPGSADAQLLLKNAGTALRGARAAGGGRSRFFRSEMDTDIRDRHVIEELIGRALAEDRFDLHFQPFYRASDRRLLGFEALLRLSGEDGRPIPPRHFIPVAEAMGAITAIGASVLHKACAIAAEWPPELGVAVNLSPVQFAGGTICQTVQEALRRSGLEPKRLELEITEGLILHDTDAVLTQLRGLKALGVRIAMDDFGTGYSSLSYLWKFPFDKLKIDASFMRALEQDKASVVPILQTIVALGKSLGLEVTAEGVETDEQARLLDDLLCGSLQGFRLGRPIPASEIPAVILGDFKRMVTGLRQQILTVSEEQSAMRESA